MNQRPFKGAPIRRKLIAAFTLVAAVALLLAAVFFVANELSNLRSNAEKELAALASVIGANSTAALAFNDKGAAQETLATLSSVPDVTLAVLYDKSGQEFAQYSRKEKSVGAPSSNTGSLNYRELHLSRPVILDGQVLGKVEIFADMASRLAQLREDLVTGLTFIIGSLVVAVLLAWRLQRAITGPIGVLTDALRMVSRENDYGVRVPVTQDDEIGVLQQGLNDVLQRVQERDTELEQHRQHLEAEVSRRTADLKEANSKLKDELFERSRAETELKRAHRTLERHHQQFELLTEMNERLQVCHSMAETRPVIDFYIHRLFEAGSGAIYQMNNSRSLVESIASWGEPLPQEETFNPSDCWALRQGRLHIVEDPDNSLLCPHCKTATRTPYMCVPMLAYGDVIGLVHVRITSEVRGIADEIRHMTVTVAEHLALALANLKLREVLQAQSVRDPLTGLFNRRFMQESMEREFARADRAGGNVAVIMLDIDHFKSYNDNYGHEAGDQVLAQIGAHFERAVRAADIPCRYGGEEFTIIMPGLDIESALARSMSICEGVRNLDIRHAGRQLDGITLSAGVAVFPMHGKTAEAVLNAADAALYQAKRDGRNRVEAAPLPENTDVVSDGRA